MLEIKKGDKLWRILYFVEKRRIDCFEVISIKDDKVICKTDEGGRKQIKKSRIGSGGKFFRSKKEAIQNKIDQHEGHINDLKKDLSVARGEVTRLKKELENEKNSNLPKD